VPIAHLTGTHLVDTDYSVCHATSAFHSTAAGRRLRRQLYGQGTADSSYYWVWVPTGVASVVTPPPAPRLPQVHAEGRWQLYGDGTTQAPYTGSAPDAFSWHQLVLVTAPSSCGAVLVRVAAFS
jgi:hypothetical protein